MKYKLHNLKGFFMKNLKYFIEKGSQKIGGITKLGEFLKVSQPNMSSAKAEKRQLPMSACVVLADYINENPLKIIAYSQLTTETDEEKIQIWKRVLEKKEDKKTEKVIFKKLLFILRQISNSKKYYFFSRIFRLFEKIVEKRDGGIKVIFHKVSVAFCHFYRRVT